MQKSTRSDIITYYPPKSILKKYADVLVNFALNSGKGLSKGEVVECAIPDVAKSLALELQNAVLQAGGYPVMRLLPTGFEKDFYTLANHGQLTFFPKKFLKEKVNLFDHGIGMIADPYPRELSQVEPQKIIKARDAKKLYRDWLVDKENQGKFTWTTALWGVEAKAKEVGLSLQEYWQQIIKACFLDKDDPIKEWRQVASHQAKIKEKLNRLSIEKLEMKGPDVNLVVKLGVDRIWSGGSGRNIPSFELFTSPDWRGTEGWMRFNQPLYRYGNVISGIELEFKAGLVVKAKAKKGNRLLQEMLKSPNADRLGEFSLTDKRMSRITHSMAETLFDENVGGPYGNSHIAIGKSYHDCFRGDQSKITKKGWAQRGFNDAAEHTDVVSTTRRIVTAFLSDGSQKVIYQDGQFTV